MWYELLPTLAILGTFAVVPHIIPIYVNEWLYGNPMRRKLEDNWDVRMFERDNALTSAVWKTAGLENIPDK